MPEQPREPVEPGSAADRLDASRVAALYGEHAERLRRFLRGILRSPEAAEDALHSTFAKALESGDAVRDGAQRAWLYRVALNEALALRRRQQVERRAAERVAGPDATGLRAAANDPHAGAIRWEAVVRVREALASLPAEQRLVVEMRMREEKTFARIADELSLPLGTVLSRMHAALAKLRRKLDEIDPTS